VKNTEIGKKGIFRKIRIFSKIRKKGKNGISEKGGIFRGVKKGYFWGV